MLNFWFCCKLTPQAIKVIESIVASGKDARVTSSKDGYVVYEEKKRKIHVEIVPK